MCNIKFAIISILSYNSVALTTFTVLYSRHCYLCPKFFQEWLHSRSEAILEQKHTSGWHFHRSHTHTLQTPASISHVHTRCRSQLTSLTHTHPADPSSHLSHTHNPVNPSFHRSHEHTLQVPACSGGDFVSCDSLKLRKSAPSSLHQWNDITVPSLTRKF